MLEMSGRKHVTTACRASQVNGTLKDSFVKFKKKINVEVYMPASLPVDRECVQNSFQTFEK